MGLRTHCQLRWKLVWMNALSNRDASRLLGTLEMIVELRGAWRQTLAGARRRTQADIAAQLQVFETSGKERLIDCYTALFRAAITYKEW